MKIKQDVVIGPSGKQGGCERRPGRKCHTDFVAKKFPSEPQITAGGYVGRIHLLKGRVADRLMSPLLMRLEQKSRTQSRDTLGSSVYLQEAGRVTSPVMATRLLVTRRRLLASYLPCLQSATSNLRNFSSDSKRLEPEHIFEEAANSQTVWPDESLGPFGPQDRRFPLPGLVGTSTKLQQPFFHRPHASPVQVLPPLPLDRHSHIADQFLASAEDVEATSGYLEDPPIPTAADMLECVAQSCPHIIRKDFSDLFPGRDIMDGAFTVVTISQRTQHDMTGWSPDVEIEREALLETFIQGAREICDALHQSGYWADFIDPSCGKPYLGPHTNSSLFETDERYRRLGFEIDDLGCCKVIRHHVWGTHAFIGCLFTTAPLDHPLLQQMGAPDK